MGRNGQERIWIPRFFIYVLVLAAIYVAINRLLPYAGVYYPEILHYSGYINEAAIIAIAGGGGYAIARMILKISDSIIARKGEVRKEVRFVHTALSIFLYGIVVAVVLYALHINLTGLLVGGAVGGVIIGLAVQTVASNLFAGLLISGSNTVNVGDVVEFHSGTIGGNLIGTVRKVTVLFTYVEDVNGITVKLPNSSFLNSTTFASLEVGGSIRYEYSVSLGDDVQSGQLIKRVKESINEERVVPGLVDVNLYLMSKNGAMNTYSVVINFRNPRNFNEVVSGVNQAIERSYNDLKAASRP